MSEFDETLTKLFAEARESLPAEDFLERVATDVTRVRRRDVIRRALLILPAAAVAVAATPYVAAGSLRVVSHLGPWLPALSGSLDSPVTWLCWLAVVAWGRWKMRLR